MLTIDSIQKFLKISKDEIAKHPDYSVMTFYGDDHFVSDPTRSLLFGLSIISSGSVKLKYNSHAYVGEAGQLLAICPGSIISFQSASQDLTGLTLFFDRQFLSEKINDKTFFATLPIFQFGANPVLALTEGEQHRLETLINLASSYYQNSEHGNVNTVKYIILAVLSEIGYICSRNGNNVYPSILDRPKELTGLFLQNLSQQYISDRNISHYAEQLAVSKKHLSETVKAVTGKPASFWIDLMLVQEAQILLKQTHLTISEISNSLGFGDQSSFGKFFRQRVRISPGQYRKETKNN